MGTLSPALNPIIANIADSPRRRRGMSPNQWRCQMAQVTPPAEGIVLTHFIVSDDVERSRRFYTEVLGGKLAFSGPGGLTYVALANSWIIINVGGGPTDDKPAVTLETPRDLDRVSSFLNIRVKDIRAVYDEWSARGANFLTPPKQHQYEIRCYIRDPDGYLIEVGQTTDPEGDWSLWLPSPSRS
jgi:catechol 2,3-dioxygenase-like lactoylglutathione lyase family enzyme